MKVVVTGADGQLGRALARTSWPPGCTLHRLSRHDLDIRDAPSVLNRLRQIEPGIIVNAAAYTDVDGAERDPETAAAVNCTAVHSLALASREIGSALIHISTDFVFDGTRRTPYAESDYINPLGVYARTKADGEERLRAALDRHIIIRTSWLFSAHGRNFLTTMLRLARTRTEISVVDDRHGCPTPAASLASAIAVVASRMRSGGATPWGTYHLCGAPPTTWFGFAERIFAAAAPWLDHPVRLKAISGSDFPTPAPRPQSTILDCRRLREQFLIDLPNWADALRDTVREALKGEART